MNRSLLFIFVLIASFNSFACEDVVESEAREYVSKELEMSPDLLRVEMTELDSDEDWDWMSVSYEVYVRSNTAQMLAKLLMNVMMMRTGDGMIVCEEVDLDVLFIVDKDDEGEVVDCMNVDEHYEEDSLYINFSALRGRYFDNDEERELTCTVGKEAETDATIYCKQKGTEGELLTRITPDGNAIVIYGEDQWIDFQCTRASPGSRL